MEEKEKPTYVKLIIGLEIAIGLLSLLMVLSTHWWLAAAFAVLALITAWGVAKRQSWAKVLGLVFNGLSLLVAMILAAVLKDSEMSLVMLGMVALCFILVYALLRTDVGAWVQAKEEEAV